MRRTVILLPLALAIMPACQAADGPVSPTAPTPGLGATNIKILQPFSLISDDDPARNYTVTFGLVSPVSELSECGGSGQTVTDGGGITRVLITPSGAFHIRNQLSQATIVLYEGGTIDDVCELSSRPIIGTGTGNLHFTTKEKSDGTLGVQATFGGILDLAAGGRAHMLAVGNIVFDALGNMTIHEDHFTLKPIGK